MSWTDGVHIRVEISRIVTKKHPKVMTSKYKYKILNPNISLAQ